MDNKVSETVLEDSNENEYFPDTSTPKRRLYPSPSWIGHMFRMENRSLCSTPSAQISQHTIELSSDSLNSLAESSYDSIDLFNDNQSLNKP